MCGPMSRVGGGGGDGSERFIGGSPSWASRAAAGRDSRESLACNEILKEISPECSLEGLMLKLKLQYFGYLTQRADSSEKTLMLGEIEGARRRERQGMRWLDGISDSMDMSFE